MKYILGFSRILGINEYPVWIMYLLRARVSSQQNVSISVCMSRTQQHRQYRQYNHTVELPYSHACRALYYATDQLLFYS